MNYRNANNPWRNPGISHGLRCLHLAEYERKRGVKAAPYGQPNTSPDVEIYLSGCLRNLDDDPELENLMLKAGNWCAAFVSWCSDICLLPGEEKPHEYRAGVVEIIADAKSRGRWIPASEVIAQRVSVSPGDLVIWDRSKPGRPETSWHRHVNRLKSLTATGIRTIGGNERRTIIDTSDAPKGLDHDKLIGFVSYAQETSGQQMPPTDRWKVTSADLAALAMYNQKVLQDRRIP